MFQEFNCTEACRTIFKHYEEWRTTERTRLHGSTQITVHFFAATLLILRAFLENGSLCAFLRLNGSQKTSVLSLALKPSTSPCEVISLRDL